MRTFPGLTALLAPALALTFVGAAQGGFSGTVQRIDERTYRIQLEASYDLMVWPDCPDSSLCEICSYNCPFYCGDWNYFNLSGPFGLLTGQNLNSSCLECGIEEDQIRCNGPCTGITMQFDFEPSITGISRLTLRWGMSGEYMCSACTFWDTICGQGGDGGEVYAVLPSRIGDSAALETVVAVERSTWSTVKTLYRD